MRTFAKLEPKFWESSQTGRQIIKCGAETTVLAIYLLSAPDSNHLGIYFLRLGRAAADTCLSQETVNKSLKKLIDIGFCRYDDDSEIVWITKMAEHQGSLRMSPKQMSGSIKLLRKVAHSPLFLDFCTTYPEFAGYVDAVETVAVEPVSEPIADEIVEAKVNKNLEERQKRQQFAADICSLWNEICIDLPRAEDITQSRISAIHQRTKQNKMMLDDWRKFFQRIHASEFLNGRGKTDFTAKFDWCLYPSNFLKIKEGNYDNRAKKPTDGTDVILQDRIAATDCKFQHYESGLECSKDKPYCKYCEAGK